MVIELLKIPVPKFYRKYYTLENSIMIIHLLVRKLVGIDLEKNNVTRIINNTRFKIIDVLIIALGVNDLNK